MESVLSEKAGKIQSLTKEDVHRICSGQVILNLSIAVKELIENSLDAESTNIEIRLREHGKEMIEVIDNGNGIHEDNFQSIALKHHTSKLRNFSDISSVDTFGFRGEAISSLCALSNLIITTRHTSSSHASRIVFDRNGLIKELTPIARQIGTTTCLTNIFSTLPVRQKEFHRNIKKEFSKMTQLVSAYCLMSLGVKITCSNYTKRDGKTTFLATEGSKSLKENIVKLFGSKQLNSLTEITKCKIGNEESDKEDNPEFEIEGFISNCESGSGRTCSDRQFYYVNYRPCEYPKLSRIVNEIYHRFNQNQYPFVALNIIMDKSSIDINVTPDKRKIFIQHEQLLIDAIKDFLLKLYENTACTFKVTNMPSTELCQKSFNIDLTRLHCFSTRNKRPAVDENTSNLKQQKLDCIYPYSTTIVEKLEHIKNNTPEKIDPEEHENENIEKQSNDADVNLNPLCREEENADDNVCNNKIKNMKNDKIENTKNDEIKGVVEIISENDDKENIEILEVQTNTETERNLNINDNLPTRYEEEPPVTKISESNVTPLVKEEFTRPKENSPVVHCHNLQRKVEVIVSHEKMECTESSNIVEIIDDTEIIRSHHGRRCTLAKANIDEIKKKLNKLKKLKSDRSLKITNKFHAEIDPSTNELAESELSKEITKDMFSQMEIIGQFNLGFIITRLNQDLFIVDQHASDEKYNFEILQKNTVISNQKLVIPQNLELTAVNESVLIDNLDIMRRNGFEFHIDLSEMPTKKVKLTAIPICKNWKFGKEDISEMLFMLQDAPGIMCRPSRVRTMFASQACRKSIMIGSALSTTDMRQLIDHMKEMDQPWNCPHGRPTMRHLVNISLLS